MTVPQGILPFNLIPDTDKSVVTSFAGLPLVPEPVVKVVKRILLGGS